MRAQALEQALALVQPTTTGDLLPPAPAAECAPAGLDAGSVMDAGAPVLEGILLSVPKEDANAAAAARGLLRDGFPRGAGQAQEVDSLPDETGRSVTTAVSLWVDAAATVASVAGRRTCSGCGRPYHDFVKCPAAAGNCDQCGGTAFKRRADDNAETVAARLAAHRAGTAPLIDGRDERGVLQRTTAMRDIAVVRDAPHPILGCVPA
jgi:adenylate kinase